MLFRKIRKEIAVPLCLGALAGAAFAAIQAMHKHLAISLWTVVSLMDFVSFVCFGALAGLTLACLMILIIRAGTLISVRNIVAVTISGLIVSAVAILVLVVVLRPLQPAQQSRQATRRQDRLPDIVVVIYDAVRADILYDQRGGVPDWCPRLKELASRGLVFRNAVSPAPWTLPSHASLFTGLSELDHGATEECPVLRPQMTTIAEVLRDRGYYTVALVANPWVSRARGFDQGFDRYLELWQIRDDVPLMFRAANRLGWTRWPFQDNPQHDKGAMLASRLAEDTIAKLDSQTPLLLFVNLVDAHPPYWAPEPYRLSLVPPQAIARGIVPQAISQDWVSILTGQTSLNRAQLAVIRGLNQGEVAYMDKHLGRVLDALKNAGRLETSLIAVTADHGAALGEGRLFGSGFDLREEMIRIPLIVQFPKRQQAGQVRDDLVYLHDLYPTITQIVDGSPNKDQPASTVEVARGGVSLLRPGARLYGLSSYGRPVNMLYNLWQRTPEFDASLFDRRLLALRGRHYKFVWSSSGAQHLYDLSAKGENENIANPVTPLFKQHEGLMKTILEMDPGDAWTRMLHVARNSGSRKGNTLMDERTLKGLQSLGYVGGQK